MAMQKFIKPPVKDLAKATEVTLSSDERRVDSRSISVGGE